MSHVIICLAALLVAIPFLGAEDPTPLVKEGCFGSYNACLRHLPEEAKGFHPIYDLCDFRCRLIDGFVGGQCLVSHLCKTEVDRRFKGYMCFCYRSRIRPQQSWPQQ